MNKIKIASLTLSAAALVGMAVHEGYRDKPYYATADEQRRGILTCDFGDTQECKPGQKSSVEKALVKLLARSNQFEQGLKNCISPDAEMTQNEWDATVSWAYNVGLGNACASTLVKKISAGQEFCSELLRWNKQSGVVLEGLTKRRKEEYAKCIS